MNILGMSMGKNPEGRPNHVRMETADDATPAWRPADIRSFTAESATLRDVQS